MIQNRLAFNFVGIPVNIGAISFNLGEWLSDVHFNAILTLFISILAIVWWCMKIYDQFITTRNRKLEQKNKS